MPILEHWASRRRNATHTTEAAATLLQSGLLVGTLLVGLQRRDVFPGSVTKILLVGALLMAFMQDEQFGPVTALAAGLVGDLALWRLRRPFRNRPSITGQEDARFHSQPTRLRLPVSPQMERHVLYLH